MAILKFEDIHKAYGEVLALSGVSFEVEAGEVFGLLGPNGAGKTTLIRILLDIIRPNSGRISVFGEPRVRDHADRIGYLPEERGLYVKHKVVDVMTYFGTLKGLSRREANARSLRWLERIELAETVRWRVSRLSKGMSQKVQIAATLLAEPELCLLDEPFTGLDPLNVRLVQDLILSTHQMNLVETLCDRVALIHRGRVKEYGSVGEVRRRHSLPEVRFTLSSPLPAVRGVAKLLPVGEGSWRALLDDGVSPSEILGRLVEAGAGVEHFEKVLTPMEDVFIRVVQEDYQ